MREETGLIFLPGIKAQNEENQVNENCICSNINSLYKGEKGENYQQYTSCVGATVTKNTRTIARKEGQVREEKQKIFLLSRLFLLVYKIRTATAECVTRCRDSENMVKQHSWPKHRYLKLCRKLLKVSSVNFAPWKQRVA